MEQRRSLITDFAKKTGHPIYYNGLKEDMQKWIGQRLREERKKQKLSQNHVADKIYSSSSAVSNIEKGHALRSLELLMRLCFLYKLVLGDLLNEAHFNCLVNYYGNYL